MIQLKPITEERYEEMLNVLPPRIQLSHGFLVGEPISDRICRVVNAERPTYSAYFRYRGQHFKAAEAMTANEFSVFARDSLATAAAVFAQGGVPVLDNLPAA